MKKVEQQKIDSQSEKTTGVTNNLEEKDHGEETVRKRFQIQFDFDYVPTNGKLMSNENIVVPDLNLTVRQLLQNHTRGIDGGEKVRQPLYFDFPIPSITDITDVMEYKRFLNERMEQVNQFMKENKIEEEENTEESSGEKVE